MTLYQTAKNAEDAMDAACKAAAGRRWLDARYTDAFDHVPEVAAAKAAYDAACAALFKRERGQRAGAQS